MAKSRRNKSNTKTPKRATSNAPQFLDNFGLSQQSGNTGEETAQRLESSPTLSNNIKQSGVADHNAERSSILDNDGGAEDQESEDSECRNQLIKFALSVDWPKELRAMNGRMEELHKSIGKLSDWSTENREKFKAMEREEEERAVALEEWIKDKVAAVEMEVKKELAAKEEAAKEMKERFEAKEQEVNERIAAMEKNQNERLTALKMKIKDIEKFLEIYEDKVRM